MMDGMMPGMMWAMGFVWLLVIIVLILAASSSRQISALLTPETGNEEVGNSCAGDNCVALAGPRDAENGLSHRCSSKRRDNAVFLGTGETPYPRNGREQHRRVSSKDNSHSNQ